MPLELNGKVVCKSASAYVVLEVTGRGYVVEHSCEYGHYSKLELPEEVGLGPRPRVGLRSVFSPLHVTLRNLIVVSDKGSNVRNL